MANRLQLKRGSGAPGSIFYAGEPIFDQSGQVLYVGDTGGTGTGAGSSIASSNAYDTVLEMLSKADAAGSGALKLYEDTDNGTNVITLRAPAAVTTDVTLTLPDGAGSANQIIQSDGSGNLSFTNLLTISDGTATDAIIPADTITFAGTGNEIETAVTANTVTIGLPDNVIVGGALTVTTNLTVNGNTTLGDAATDTVSFGAAVSSNIIPSADSTHDLGTNLVRWANVYADTFTGNLVGNVDNASFISVGSSAADASHYLTFVDSNNGTRAQESLYTDAGVSYNPSTNTLTAGNISVTTDLVVNGDLKVVGAAVTFETETIKVEDRLIELGLVAGAEPTGTTTWDSGVAFNYFQTSAKKSGVVWLNNQFMAMLSELSDGGGTGNDNPQITATAYAPVAAGGLYIGGINAGNEVINSTQEAVNLVFDGGSY